ncbi:acyltransferase family protein [Dictyobacter alpinus]|uniref:acyltransferase family protein n=1 Tax=Dictyobacter alpinus TaxID=2014873 RepID=UPI001FE79804|nr:acyltransferase [Dictyobacter alpinus]
MQMQVFSQSVTHTLEDGKHKKSIRSLDGVRAIACLGVVSFHLNLWSLIGHVWSPALDDTGAIFSSLALMGESGVLLFFVLSGFLLFLPYAKAMLFDSEWPSLRRFYIRRVFRILPAYYVTLFLMLLYLSPDYLLPQYRDKLWLFLTFRMDLPATYQQLNAPFWTLAIEFQFYLLLPLIAWLMGRLVRWGSLNMRLFKLTICLLVMFTWGMATRYWGFKLADTNQLDYLIPHSLADTLRPFIFGTVSKFFESFAIGMFVCMIYIYSQHASPIAKTRRSLRLLAPFSFLFGITLLCVVNLWHYYVIYMIGRSLHFLDPYHEFLEGYRDIFMQVGFSLSYGFALFAILFGPRWLQRPFEWSPLRWLGFISFSLYMWHDPLILYFLGSLLPHFQAMEWSGPAKYAAYVLWVIVTAIPLSFIFYRRIELPGMRLGEKLCQLSAARKPAIAATPVTVPDSRTLRTPKPSSSSS